MIALIFVSLFFNYHKNNPPGVLKKLKEMSKDPFNTAKVTASGTIEPHVHYYTQTFVERKSQDASAKKKSYFDVYKSLLCVTKQKDLKRKKWEQSQSNGQNKFVLYASNLPIVDLGIFNVGETLDTLNKTGNKLVSS